MNLDEDCGSKVSKSFSNNCSSKFINQHSPINIFSLSARKILSLIIELRRKIKIAIVIVFSCTVLITILTIIGSILPTREKAISDFNHALVSKDIIKITKLLSSSNPNLKINESTVKPMLDYMDKNPSWVKNMMNSMQSQGNNYNSFSSDVTLKNKKLFIFFNSYSFEVKPYFINIASNLKDADILVNDKALCTTDKKNFSMRAGPFLPGIYTVRGVYYGQYAKLESNQQITLTQSNCYPSDTKDIGLIFNEKYVDIHCNFKDAKLLVNGIDTGLLIKDAVQFGPVDNSVKVQAVKEFPWGIIKSTEVPVESSLWYIVYIEMSPVNDQLRNSLIQTINQYKKSKIQALMDRDVSKINCITDRRLEYEKKNIDDMVSSGTYFAGRINKITYDLDSIMVSRNNGEYYAEVSDLEAYNNAYYYEKNKHYKNCISNFKRDYSLVYDQKGNKWLIDDSRLTDTAISSNTKVFTNRDFLLNN